MYYVLWVIGDCAWYWPLWGYTSLCKLCCTRFISDKVILISILYIKTYVSL
jgi:hypothetical protein